MGFVFPRTQQGKKHVNIVFGDLIWIHRCKERLCTQRKSKLVPCANGPFRELKNDGVGANDSMNLRVNPFQQGGYDVPHHKRLGPRK